MKITMIVLICSLLQVSAKSYGQRVSINKKNSSIHTLLEEIRRQTEYDFFYDTNLFLKEKSVNLNIKDAAIEEALTTIFEGRPYQYVIKKNMVVITAADKPAKIVEAAPLPKQQPGRISGKIIDERGEPLPRAGIKIVQTNKVLQSNVDGSYSLAIAEGIYTIEISYISFQTKRITDVVVKAGQLTSLDIVLDAATNKLAQVIVTATFKNESTKALYVRQKNDAVLSNGISREQMDALPDKNIGETLKRISGVSTTDNRRVVVRGIAERYNVAMMDGATLPSTDVQVRDFEFDIIPSNLVDNVIVSKTASPDMSFGFGGGLVQVNTMAIPSQDFMSFSIGSKYINGSTGKDFLGYQRGKSDYLSFDDGKRDHFPKDLFYLTSGNYNPTNPYGSTAPAGTEKITPEMIAAQNKKIGGTERLGTRIYKTAPGQNYQFSLGRNYSLKNSRFGFVGSLSYRNEQAIDDLVGFERGVFNKLNENYYDPTTNEELQKTTAQQYNFTTNLGALVNIGWNSKNHKVSLRNFYSRAFANQFFYISGWGEDIKGDNPSIREYDRPKFIDLLQNRVSGEHSFGKLRFDWGIARNSVNNHEQDAVDAYLVPTNSLNGITYNYTPGSTSGGSTNPGPLSRSSYKYEETNWMADAALSYKFNVGKSVQVFKSGYQFMGKKGGYDWNVLPIGVASSFTEGYKPVQQWNNEFADPLHDMYYYPAGFNNKSYIGKNNNQAGYAMMDNRFNSWLRLVWGMRAEYYKYEKVLDGAADKISQADLDNADKQRFVDPETGNLVHRTYDASAEEKKWQYMPSANLTITPFNNFNVRASYAKSAVRPALIENSSFSRFNYLYGRIQRNTGVISTIISHYDVRMEWYPSAGEVISAGYFKKHFKSPVEMYLDVTWSSGAIDLLTANSDFANINGWEFDMRKNLGFINSNWKFLGNMYVSGNFTLQKSEVQASSFNYTSMGASEDNDGRTYQYRSKTYLREKRPLYGQVPVLYNAALQYAGERLSANVAFNHSGYKTFTVGMQPQYSEMERPRNQLDAQLGFKFLKSKKLETRLNISNLLNNPYRFFINGKNTYKIKPGTSNMTMKEWSDVYEWKYGFSDKYEEGYYETTEAGTVIRIGDTDSFIRKVGTAFSLSLNYNL